MKFTNKSTHDAEISLYEVVDFFSSNFKKIFFSGIIFAVFALFYSYTIPPQFISTVDIRLGQLFKERIQDPKLLIYNLRLPEYYSNETVNLCVNKDHLDNFAFDDLEKRRFLVQKVRSSLNRDADGSIVTVVFQSESIERNNVCLPSIINDIYNYELNISLPITDLMNNQKKILNEKLSLIQGFKKERANKSQVQNVVIELMMDTLISEMETRTFENWYDLNLGLMSPQTRNLEIVSNISSNNNPISPRRQLMVALAFFLGSFISSIFLLFLRNKTVN